MEPRCKAGSGNEKAWLEVDYDKTGPASSVDLYDKRNAGSIRIECSNDGEVFIRTDSNVTFSGSVEELENILEKHVMFMEYIDSIEVGDE